MKSELKSFVVAVSVLLFAVGSANAITALDQDQSNNSLTLRGFTYQGSVQCLAQSFQQTNANVAGAGIFLAPIAPDQTGTVTIELYNGLPDSGGTKLAGGSVSCTTGVAGGWVDVSWTAVPVAPNTTYYLVFSGTAADPRVLKGAMNAYGLGNAYWGTGVYTLQSIWDFAFRTYYSQNAAPVAVDDIAITQINSAVKVDVLDNDSDPDGDSLTIASFTQGTKGTVAAVEGGLLYTPNEDSFGTDTFTYTISDGQGGTSTALVLIVVNPKDVLIDIKPGSYPNSINLGSNGVVPIAILSTADFDATTVDPATVSMAGAGVAMRGKGNRLMASN